MLLSKLRAIWADSSFMRYLVVGGLNTAWGYLLILSCMYLLHWSVEASNVAGYSIGLLSSYALNRTVTFSSTAKRRTELPRFIAVVVLSFAANMLTLILLAHRLGVNPVIAQAAAITVYVLVSYTLHRTFVFAAGRRTEIPHHG
jgi:putative flippase GtrA